MSHQPHGQILITGAVGGLGTAMTQRLLDEGHTIVACDRAAQQAGEWLERFPADQQDRVSFYPVGCHQRRPGYRFG